MPQSLRLIALCLVLLMVLGCSGEKKDAEVAEAVEATNTPATEPSAVDAADASGEPDYISVQHILVAFAGSVPGKTITRSQVDAAAFAAELLARAQGGEDFDALVKEYTDDAHPGIYHMANFSAKEDFDNVILPRKGMVPAFGDIGFSLAVGEVGLAPYDVKSSQFGYHIIKRVK